MITSLKFKVKVTPPVHHAAAVNRCIIAQTCQSDKLAMVTYALTEPAAMTHAYIYYII